MAVDTTMARMGPTGVSVDGTDLGGTVGPSAVVFRFSDAPLVFQQRGTEPIDLNRTGFGAMIRFGIGEVANLARLVVGFPGESVVTDGTKKRISLTGQVGMQAQRDAAYSAIVMKPYEGGVETTDANEWITAPRGFIKASGDFSVGLGEQTVLNCEAECLPDASNVRLILGDATAT